MGFPEVNVVSNLSFAPSVGLFLVLRKLRPRLVVQLRSSVYYFSSLLAALQHLRLAFRLIVAVFTFLHDLLFAAL